MTSEVTLMPLRAPTLVNIEAERILVGNDLLELVTTGMYVDPLTIYREYVQNAADAVDDAVEAGLLSGASEGRIHLDIDPAARAITIRDNGSGLARAECFGRLTALGGSGKRMKKRRGFRGIGRLSGLAYCQTLRFRTRSRQSEPVCEVSWDVRKLREALRKEQGVVSLDETIKSAISVRTFPAPDEEPHFFEVHLSGVLRLANDVLLNELAVSEYLAQVAPVPFSDSFKFGSEISALLAEHDAAGRTFDVTIGRDRNRLFRPFRSGFLARKATLDAFQELERVEIKGNDGGTAAIGWVLHHSYLGAIPPSSLVGGIRLRKDNIQVGDSAVLERVFREPRFNSWTVGEIHVLDPKIIPNGRRDEFEASARYAVIEANVSVLAQKIAKRCRSLSAERIRQQRGREPVQDLKSSLGIVRRVRLPRILHRTAMEIIAEHLKRARRQNPSLSPKLLRELERLEKDVAPKLRPARAASSGGAHDRLLASFLSQAVAAMGLKRGFELLQKAVKADSR